MKRFKGTGDLSRDMQLGIRRGYKYTYKERQQIRREYVRKKYGNHVFPEPTRRQIPKELEWKP